MKAKALGPKVIVKAKQVDKKTAGGIILTDHIVESDQRAANQGEIVQLGDTAFDYLNPDVRPKVGDKVYFVKWAGIGRDIEEQHYRIMNDEDVIAVLEEYDD